jgi:hypothetical protein
MTHSRKILVALATAALLASPRPVRAAAPGTAPLAPLPFDHVLKFTDYTALLKGWAAARPDLVTLESIGTTPQGRELWFLTITNRATGPAAEKPALLVDGNIHANEYGGGIAALHFVWRVLRDYGTDARVTRLLDASALYVLPRVSPDGVEQTLVEGRYIRSVGRPYTSTAPPGLYQRDVDGDGRTVFMRFRDPNGPWKTHPSDKRLLVARGPDETGGEYWRVLPEGMIEGWNGATIADPDALEALDLGANFPGDREAGTRGLSAGPYPSSEPEVAAYVAAIQKRPNIVQHVTCHTFGGLILTPPVNRTEHMPPADRRAYDLLTAEGARLTGYDAMSYLFLRGESTDAHISTESGWLYDQKGIYSTITEFWNPIKAAGISLAGTTASAWLWGFHPVEDELKMLAWNDKNLGTKGFVPWHPFHHPQLGDVEIGGWDEVGVFYNPPFDRLEKEVAPHSEWLIFCGLALPRLAARSFSAEPAGKDLWKVRAVVENTGWLPTNGSQQALDRRAVGDVVAELALPKGAHLVEGDARKTLGQLAGRNEQRSTATWWAFRPGTPDRALAEWLVSAPAGARVFVTVRGERAGSARADLVLGRTK